MTDVDPEAEDDPRDHLDDLIARLNRGDHKATEQVLVAYEP